MIHLIKQLVKSTVQSVIDEMRMSSNQEQLNTAMNDLEKLKMLYQKTSAEIASLQTIVKSVAINQAQIVADMHTVYVAAKGSGYFDEPTSESETDDVDDSDSDDHSGGKGGMGGMIN